MQLKDMKRRGVVHRNIRTQSILVRSIVKTVEITDLGSATFIHEGPFRENISTETIAAPEWYARGEAEGIPESVWQLGVLLYEMVCGNMILDSSMDLFGNVSVSKEFKNLVENCLKCVPEERPTLDGILSHAWFSCNAEHF